MGRVQVVADLVRRRALAVRQTGYYCSIFECVVIAYLRNVPVKLLFGTEQVDIYDRFKDDLAPQPPREKRTWYRFVAVRVFPGGSLYSADKVSSQAGPSTTLRTSPIPVRSPTSPPRSAIPIRLRSPPSKSICPMALGGRHAMLPAIKGCASTIHLLAAGL